MAHKKSIGRKLSAEAMAYAQELVRICEPAIRSGSYCVNPDDAVEDQVQLTAEEAGRICFEALQRAARTGWLQETEVNLEKLNIRLAYESELKNHSTIGKTYEALGKKLHRGERDLQRQLQRKKPVKG